MRQMFSRIFPLTLLFLFGCQWSNIINHEIDTPVAAVKPIVPASGPVVRPPTLPIVFIPYKRFLVATEAIQETPFSYIHFPKQPTTSKLKIQYRQICQMYLSSFDNKANLVKYLDKRQEKLIPVYWFTKQKQKIDTCDLLITGYDYERARRLYPKATTYTPSLIAIFDNYTIRMDLKQLTSEEDLDLAFSIWKQYIVNYPSASKDLDVVTLMFSMKKVLGAFEHILTFSKS